MQTLKSIIAVLVMATVLLVGSSIALAQPSASAPPTGNIAIRDGINPGEVVVSWDAVPEATHYRIGYVNMVTDYPLAKSSVTGDWINAFIYVDENARNIQVSNGRAEYTIRRLEQGVHHEFTVLTSNHFVDSGGGGSVSSTFAWPPKGSRWEEHTVADRGGATAPTPGFDFVSMYPNCDAVQAHYPGGVRRGSPIYRPALDRDGDGIACETAAVRSFSAATDRAALVALYATNGANWNNNSNWLSDLPIGEWHGVTTDGNGRVTSLSITDNQIRGEIPVQLGDLTELRHLSLSGNRLSGELPVELGRLTKLNNLYLNGNRRLTGEIPEQLGNLSNLRRVDFDLNQLTGQIPPELGGLSNLEFLRLSDNRFTGSVPPELGNLVNLRHLEFKK